MARQPNNRCLTLHKHRFSPHSIIGRKVWVMSHDPLAPHTSHEHRRNSAPASLLLCPAWPSLPPSLIEQSLLDLNCSLHQFLNHPKISILINRRDEDIFRYLTNLQVRPKTCFLLGSGKESGPWRWGGLGGKGLGVVGISTLPLTWAGTGSQTYLHGL